jgi:3-phenylpropionate/trans-cinnamate dioxygenase ferredoxin reductase subunit
MEKVVIIGAGQAGARAALALRDIGWQGSITILGDEALPPYERPPLSKEVLLGAAEASDAPVADPAEYARQGIDLLTGVEVVRIDIDKRRVGTAKSETFEYDHLIIATGARARPLTVKGGGLPGVFTLRDANDSRRLRAALQEARHVAIIGGGFIGLEVAAAARKIGRPATVIEQAPACLGRVLPESAVKPIIEYHISHGVDILCNRSVAELEGDGRVELVRLADGTAIHADVVVAGIGSIANDELARNFGITCSGNGILVDAQCRTSVPNIYAIGDVAARIDPASGRALRLESWENAERQGVQVAAAIGGGCVEEAGAPWFWTDQYDMNVQILGTPDVHDQMVERGTDSNGPVIQFYLRDGVLSSAVLFNAGREKRTIAKLIGKEVAPSKLADPALPLKPLVDA